jgi:hypothetical protein
MPKGVWLLVNVSCPPGKKFVREATFSSTGKIGLDFIKEYDIFV